MARRSSVKTNPPAMKAIREACGLSTSKLVKLLREEQGVDLHINSLNSIERGHRGTSPEVARAIAKVLRVDLAAILAPPPATPTPENDDDSTPDGAAVGAG